MHGMVDLRDEVEITVERVGRGSGRTLLEATCRIRGEVVSIGKAILAAPTYAYVYPGQGIQRAKMGMENPTPVMRQVWSRADVYTREHLGFSIEAIVRDNPTSLRVGDMTLRHPEGVLNLTQFTQVALATLAPQNCVFLLSTGLPRPVSLPLFPRFSLLRVATLLSAPCGVKQFTLACVNYWVLSVRLQLMFPSVSPACGSWGQVGLTE